MDYEIQHVHQSHSAARVDLRHQPGANKDQRAPEGLTPPNCLMHLLS